MIEGGTHFTVRVSVYNLTSLKLSFAKNPIPQNPARTSVLLSRVPDTCHVFMRRSPSFSIRTNSPERDAELIFHRCHGLIYELKWTCNIRTTARHPLYFFGDPPE